VKLALPRPSTVMARLPFPYRAPTVPGGIEPEREPKRTGIDFETEWARTFAARFTRLAVLETVMRPTVRLLADPDREGLDRLEDLRNQDPVPPLIFAANHHSHVDTMLMLTSLPEPWRHRSFVAAASDYFFKTRVTGTLSALVLNAIPIERSKVSRRSADDAAELINEGWSLVIYPEGGRSPDGWGQAFKGGAAYLAIRCGVAVVPVHLEGTGRILRKGKTTPRPSRTRVTFGAPLRAGEGEDSRRFAARIEHAVAALADEASTDWYTARLRSHRDATPTLAGPEGASWRRAWALGDREPKRRRVHRDKPWPDLG
jgi:1-acyl-sn-glycerol-3-phosphate acyltransferase